MIRTGAFATNKTTMGSLPKANEEIEPYAFSIADQVVEAHLITGIHGGDREAFDSLISPYLNVFTLGIHRILEDDDDTQAALRTALHSIRTEMPRFSGRTKFPTWAYRICLDEALMLRRARLYKGAY